VPEPIELTDDEQCRATDSVGTIRATTGRNAVAVRVEDGWEVIWSYCRPELRRSFYRDGIPTAGCIAEEWDLLYSPEAS
jgi:hypothetical protein